jgi:hypothetical protein
LENHGYRAGPAAAPIFQTRKAALHDPIRAEQPQQGAAKDCLSTAGLADERHHFAAVYVQGHIPQGFADAGFSPEMYGQMFDGQ